MPGRRPSRRRRLPAGTYLELLRSLFTTVVSSTIMGAVFILTAWSCAAANRHPLLVSIALIGSLVAILRVTAIVRLKHWIPGSGLDLRTGRIAERIYGAVYLSFAAIVGLFGAVALQLLPATYQLPVIAQVVGYGAGVAATMSLRPWFGIPAIMLGVIPTVGSALVLGDDEHMLLAIVLAAFLLGGIRSMIARYRTAVEMIELRQRFGSLARSDPLTGLANRFALEETLGQIAEAGAADRFILHCLDLDRFKPVNDVHGHVVGDLLLKAVGLRLQRLLRSGDLAVRLGGDEFAVLQTNIAHADEGNLLARRIARTLAEPFSIEGRDIQIGASLGSAAGRAHGAELATLIGIADVGLYKQKEAGRLHRALAG